MPSEPIKIGVASCFFYPKKNRGVFEKKSLCYIEKDMGRYLACPNVLPILIPDLSESQLQNFLDEMSGFVFQGGSDISPHTYGEEPILDGKWKGDPYRDQFELKIFDYAMKKQRPILGICRGFQLMNVYFGGSLYQDIVTQHPHAILHRDGELYDQLHHEIEFSEGGWLGKLFKKDRSRRVNSVHHQGIQKLGKDLEVLAWSPQDRLIEAIGYQGAEEGKVFGVQWHPEFFYNSKTPLIQDQIIYDCFLSFCQK